MNEKVVLINCLKNISIKPYKLNSVMEDKRYCCLSDYCDPHDSKYEIIIEADRTKYSFICCEGDLYSILKKQKLMADKEELKKDIIRMTFKEYCKKALSTASREGLDNPMLEAALGLAGESGEFADMVKKHLFQGHELDEDALSKELGDILWYVNLGCYALNKTLEDIAIENIEKLKSRYPHGFDSYQSINRKEDKDKINRAIFDLLNKGE